MENLLNRIFKLQESKTRIRTEVCAGLTTFLAIAYILAVNPAILGDAGMNRGGVFVATALAAFIGSTVMAFLGNFPFVLAPGMGLNAYFTYAIVKTFGFSWQFALFAVFCEGLIFFVLSLSNVREAICNGIPMPLKNAVCAGIGLYIALIGCVNAHVVVGHEATLITMCDFNGRTFHTAGISAVFALTGVVITGVLLYKRIKGALLWSILVIYILGLLAEMTGLYVPADGYNSLVPSFKAENFSRIFSGFSDVFGAAFDAGSWTRSGSAVKGFPLALSLDFLVIIFALLFVDLFDTIGVLTGTAAKADMLDEQGRLPGIRGALLADSIATSAGAVLGTSTTTTYIESAAGVAAGGRTGLTALTAGLFFVLSLALAPVFLAVPLFATAPVLITVGFLMMSSVRKIDFDDIPSAIPCFITIIAMPFFYSIAEGICLGIISWTALNLLVGRRERVSLLLVVLSLLFIIKYAFL